MININLIHRHTPTHTMYNLPLIIKIGSGSEHVSVNTNAMGFVNKSLSCETNYLMSILFIVYLKEKSPQNILKSCYS